MNAPVAPIPTTLVTGASAAMRESAIAGALEREATTGAAVLLEGLPDGTGALDAAAAAIDARLERIAPGCLCCAGNLTMRVSLDRILRRHPPRLFIGIASADHLDEIRRLLSAPPYSEWLKLTG